MIRLPGLSPEDLFVLLHNIRHVFALGDPATYRIDDEGLHAFMAHCASTLGAEFFLTPRETVKAFVGLLLVLEQNPGVDWRALLPGTSVEKSADPEADEGPSPPEEDEGRSGGDDLETFRL